MRNFNLKKHTQGISEMEGSLEIIWTQALILQMKKLRTRGKGASPQPKVSLVKGRVWTGSHDSEVQANPAPQWLTCPQTGPFHGRFTSPFLTLVVTEIRKYITDHLLVGLKDCLQVSQQLAKVTVDFINSKPHLKNIFNNQK